MTAAAIPTLMMIDDERNDLILCRRVIDRWGLVGEVLEFTYAEHALDHLRSNREDRIDAIVLDINMPRMNGFEFLEVATAELGPAFAEVVVVMLTTSLDPRDMETARRFDVVKHYFSKPLTAEHLQQIADSLPD